MSDVNDHLVLVCGKSAVGKSASLMNMENPEGVMYLNCEAGKKLPFRSKFKEFTIIDPLQVEEAFEAANDMADVHTIVVDSLNYLMDMYESVHVLPSTNTMQAWGEYTQFFKRLMQHHVAGSSKNVIFMAHVVDQLNESDMVMESKVPAKGAIKNQGIESYFSCVISAKKKKLKDIEGYGSGLLNVTDEEEMLGYKYVFQTKLTKDTVNERMRGPMGLWDTKETFIDNDCQKVLDRLSEYYN
ncbi:AAA family ATPase [Salinimonas marina]|uniref:AAA family ATPase n=1 Tax=Salinimonas marina TaxID=2785918 RepID=A0A7S9DZX6_9ALTE|nr:AAA family ATPase [Salinimonas marina]QPG06987.1 AAA family ATPase [Salinimonas marina]